MHDIELEAKFISQEHRLIPIWENFWVKRKEWDKEDPRRKAANIAFAMFWLPKPSIIVSGGLIAFFSLYFMVKQTELLEKQNKLMNDQNILLLSQIKDQRSIGLASRKTELIKSIYSSDGEIERKVLYTKAIPTTSARIRSESITEYIQIRKSEIKTDLIKFRTSKKIPLAATLSFGIDIRWAPLQEISVNQLDMSQTSLFHSNFEAAELSYVDFSDSQMEYTNLHNTDLTGAIFNNTSLIGANLANADLTEIRWNDNTKILNANIYGVKNAPFGFKEWAIKNGALEISDSLTWINKNIEAFPVLKKNITN